MTRTLENKLDRRTFLKLLAFGGASAAIAADSRTARAGSSDAEAEAVAKLEKGRTVDGIVLAGVPEKAVNVEMPKGMFKNVLKDGTDLIPHIFAEPGGLLVGPDFGSNVGSPYGENSNGWKTMYESGGSIHPFSSVTQEIIRWSSPAFQNSPEGGFAMFAGSQMNLEIADATLGLPFKGKDHIYLVAVRGLYPDGRKDTPEKNTTVRLTNYIPGHTEVLMYESREKTNLGFVSLEQTLQRIATTHTGGTNGGAEGQSVVTLLGYDRNTGGIEWSRHWTQEKDWKNALVGANFGWQKIYSNYR